MGILSGLTECARVCGICLQLGFVLEGYKGICCMWRAGERRKEEGRR